MHSNKLIINFTPTGVIPRKDMTPHVPTFPDEIIADVLEARQYGISIVHIHARDERGNPTYNKDTYANIISGIREVAPELILCVSTTGRDFFEFEKLESSNWEFVFTSVKTSYNIEKALNTIFTLVSE